MEVRGIQDELKIYFVARLGFRTDKKVFKLIAFLSNTQSRRLTDRIHFPIANCLRESNATGVIQLNKSTVERGVNVDSRVKMQIFTHN